MWFIGIMADVISHLLFTGVLMAPFAIEYFKEKK